MKQSGWEYCTINANQYIRQCYWGIFCGAGCLGQGCTLNSGDRAHTPTAVAVVDVTARSVRIEEQVAGVVYARQVLCGRPVVAIRAGKVEVGADAVARCRQENAIAIEFACELNAFHSI